MVASISDYYKENGQIAWLENRNYSLREIGGHAGIRDTSELMVAHKKGLRDYPITPRGFKGGDSNGEYKEASKAFGEAMIALKVDAAVEQMNVILAGE